MDTIQDLIKNNNKIDYQKVCENIIKRFGIKTNVNWEAILPAQHQKELFGAELLRNIVDMPQAVGLHDIRAINLQKGELSQLLFFFIKVQNNFLNKSNILALTRKFLGGQAANNFIIWFVGNEDENQLKIVVVGKEGKKIKLKILPLEAGKWYKTYDLILDEVNKRFVTDGLFQAFAEPSKLWNAVWDSFDISIVNKQFYLGIHQYFRQIVEELNSFKNLFKEQNSKEQFAIRLIGRIIFCWFLKKKGIIEDKVLSSSAVKIFINNDEISKYNTYYSKILTSLFFEVLNTPKNKRSIDTYHLFRDYPFLNGGLFEPQEHDYFKVNDGPYYLYLSISNELFENLFKFLESYNFTIDENSSVNSEIAIDPEMLGRIFENLLAEQNPETGETARKSTGSYYTPREIVDYMVEESLIEYLKTNTTFLADDLQDFVRTESLPESLTKTDVKTEFKEQIYEALSKIKVLDPACGSGAFPIGMLQKIVALKNCCFVKQEKPEPIKNTNIKLSAKLLRQGFVPTEKQEPALNYTLKLETLQNSIFGVDIQPLATELSRLRSWLTLIVDEDQNNVQPLPNLDFKFVTANALIGIGLKEYISKNEGKIAFPEVEKLINDLKKLQTLREQYFETGTPDGFVTKIKPDKNKLKTEFNDLQTEIFKLSLTIYKQDKTIGDISQKIVAWKPFDDNSIAPFFDELWMFGIKDGFDVVIANPPYVRADQPAVADLRKQIMLSNQYQTLWEKWDLYVAFIEKGFQLLKQNGVLEFIIPDAFLTSKYGQKARLHYIEKAAINRINFCSDLKIFDASVKNIIIEIVNKDNKKHSPTKIQHKETFENQNILPTKLQTELKEKTFYLSIEANTYGNLDNTEPWENICYVSYGLRPSSDERYWKGEFTKDDLISDIQDSIHPKPYIEAKWIKKYEIEKIKYLEWNTERSPKKLVRPTFPELYNPNKILMGGMTGAILDILGLLCNHSCSISVLWIDLKNVENLSINNSIRKDFQVKGDKKELQQFRRELEEKSKLFNLKYLLAVLNSRYGSYYLQSVRRSQIGFYPDDLKKLPIKQIPIPLQTQFAKFVDYITFLNTQNLISLEDQRMPLFMAHVLDAMVYELYFEEQMKRSQREILLHIESLPKINLNDSEESNLNILRKMCNEIYNPKHPIRNTVYFIGNIDGIENIENTLNSKMK